MRRIIGGLFATLALVLTIASAAQAAPNAQATPSAPVAATGQATNVTPTTAVLHGHVNPHGAATNYSFNYGLTPSYGAGTTARAAGSGTGAVQVRDAITGLQPGTTYHFQLVAQSAAGTTTGADVTFTTAGKPPSQVATGAAVSVGEFQAGITGTINPSGAQTAWLVQYGLSTAYGLQTFPQQPIAAGLAPVNVSTTLTGLAPARLFHYRIVAFHGALATYGADGTFFTRPVNPPSPGVHATTSPKRDSRSPYAFTTQGTLSGGKFIPAADRCTGTVGIRYFRGRHQLAYKVADVDSSCAFTAHVSLRRTGASGRQRLRVTVSYRTNHYLGAGHTTDHVYAGR